LRQAVFIATISPLRAALAPLLLLFFAQWLPVAGGAQGISIEARVASVSGGSARLVNARGNFALHIHDPLAPGDVIDTRGGGRVLIELVDGSVVIVQPKSRVILKNYRAASSLRELFEITMGRVRVKINRFGGRPNPYRVNSPSASVSVRGTEFSIIVEGQETRVIVYEGLVEVTSLSDPRQRTLVEPGRGVIVRPFAAIQFFIPRANSDAGERGARGERDDNRRNSDQSNGQSSGQAGGQAGGQASGQGSQEQGGNQNAAGAGREEGARDATGSYERYTDSLIETGETPPLSRFTAFPDSHLDSLENPAYAMEFRTAEGRIYLLPSFGGRDDRRESLRIVGSVVGGPVDYGLLFQHSLFVPLPRFRATVGGSLTVSRSGLQAFTLDERATLTAPLFPPGAVGIYAVSSGTTNTSLAGSLLAARQFGSAGRTSLGVGWDYVSGRGSLLNLTSQSDAAGLTARERLESRSHIDRYGFRFGLSHEFTRGNKLGIYYRYGLVSADDRDRAHTLNGAPLGLDAKRITGRSSEIALRLRGPLTPKLFYGVESSVLMERLNERLRPAGSVEATDRGRITRAVLGAGLGYALHSRLFLSADVAGGTSRVNDLSQANVTQALLEDERQRVNFWSAHAAVQADVWKKLFVSSSILALHQQRNIVSVTPPNPLANFNTRESFTNYYSDFGIGWRFTPNFIAQYVCSTDYGRAAPGHILMLRYTFGFGDK
jgi:hypothetical protein